MLNWSKGEGCALSYVVLFSHFLSYAFSIVGIFDKVEFSNCCSFCVFSFVVEVSGASVSSELASNTIVGIVTEI